MGDANQRLMALSPHPPDCTAFVHDAQGCQWLAHIDLIDAGYSNLEDFSIVYVNEKFYELQAHTNASYRIVGKHYPSGIWWVEEVETET